MQFEMETVSKDRLLQRQGSAIYLGLNRRLQGSQLHAYLPPVPLVLIKSLNIEASLLIRI